MKTYPGRLKVLKGRVLTAVTPLLFIATIASADTAGGAASGGMSPLTLIFLGLLAAIILLQLIPALVLFSSLVVAVFKRSTKKSEAAGTEKA